MKITPPGERKIPSEGERDLDGGGQVLVEVRYSTRRLLACGLSVSVLFVLPATASGSTSLDLPAADAAPELSSPGEQGAAQVEQGVAQVEPVVDPAGQPAAQVAEQVAAEAAPAAEAATPAVQEVIVTVLPVVDVATPVVKHAGEATGPVAAPATEAATPTVQAAAEAIEPIVTAASPVIEQAVEASQPVAETTRPAAEVAAPVFTAVNGTVKTATEPVAPISDPGFELADGLLMLVGEPILIMISPLVGPLVDELMSPLAGELAGPIADLLSMLAGGSPLVPVAFTPVTDLSQVGLAPSATPLAIFAPPATHPPSSLELASAIVISPARAAGGRTATGGLAGSGFVTPAPALLSGSDVARAFGPRFSIPEIGGGAGAPDTGGLSPPHRLGGAGNPSPILTIALAALLALAIPWRVGRRWLYAARPHPPNLSFLLEHPG